MWRGAGGWGLGAPIGCHPERSDATHGSRSLATLGMTRRRRSRLLPQPPAPSPSGFNKPQSHPVALSDRLGLGVVRVVVVVAGWQRPPAVGMVLGVLRFGVGFRRRVRGY